MKKDRNKKTTIAILSLVASIMVLTTLVEGIGCQSAEIVPPPNPEKHQGSIYGHISDAEGNPLEGVAVTIFGTQLSDTTDEKGSYQIDNIPPAAPIYIIIAAKLGFFQGQAGNIDVINSKASQINLILQEETPDKLYLKEKLSVKLCYLMEIKPSRERLIPALDAVLDPSLYPEEVKLYLKPGKYIESDNPSIVELAQQIKSSLPPEDEKKQTLVAKAVYDWMVKNIEYDTMRNFSEDVTCGGWQTTYGGWGHGFAEWCYTAKEVLQERRAICIEYERLCTALLRAEGIPARPAPLRAHPVTQWWVQLPDGSGYWANMETSVGHTIYKEKGDLWAKFPSQPESDIAFHAINADAPIHMDWNTENPCLWLEDYGERRIYQHDIEGLEAAERDTQIFAKQGKIPQKPGAPRRLSTPHYELYSRGFMIDLANIGEQKIIEVKFPLFPQNEYRDLLQEIHWTNHPEWVTHTEVVTEKDDQTGEELSYYKIIFNLARLG